MSMSFADFGQRSLVSCMSKFSKDFTKTTEQISNKFHMQSQGNGSKKVYSFGQSHVTKMVLMPIYGKSLKKSCSLEPLGHLL